MDASNRTGAESAQKEPDVLFILPTIPQSDKIQDYYFGIQGKSWDAWPDLKPTQTRLQIPGPKKDTPDYQYFQFPDGLNLATEPGPHCIPQELLQFKPTEDEIHKYFFKGTSKEVYIRQIFFHTELTEQEQNWLLAIKDYCRWKNFPIRNCLDPFLLRLCYYNWRKNGDKGYIPKAYEHIIETTNWRANIFPLSDTDQDIKDDLARGVMYWTARDESLRPLLVVRLRRLPNNTPPARFKRLTVFCFEWGMKYLFVPGLVETCTVVFDVRGIAIHSFPISALSDMTNTLTRQYPFRLDRMFIINDSLFIQTVWSIAKQFLTEVQQQKMAFMRTGYDKELLKIYAAHHLEKEFGGTRSEIKSYYPFPLAPGPFKPGSLGPDPNAHANCWKALGPETSRGQFWIQDSRPDIVWGHDSQDIFKKCGLKPPPIPPPPPQSPQEEASAPPPSPPRVQTTSTPSQDASYPSGGSTRVVVISAEDDSTIISERKAIPLLPQQPTDVIQPTSYRIESPIELRLWNRRTSSNSSSNSSGDYHPRMTNSYRPPTQQFLPSSVIHQAAVSSPSTDIKLSNQGQLSNQGKQDPSMKIPAPGSSSEIFKVGVGGDGGHSDDGKQFEEKHSLNQSDETAEDTPPASSETPGLTLAPPDSPDKSQTAPVSTTKRKRRGFWSKLCCKGADVVT